MKKIMLSLSMATLLISCGKNDKECAEWMEGDDCQTQTRAKYYGAYTGSTTDQDGGVIENQNVVFDAGQALDELAIPTIPGGKCVLSASTPGAFTVNRDLDFGNFYVGDGSVGQFKGDSLFMHLILEDSINDLHSVLDFKCKKQ